jgi:AcrR family transcriptional regulator
LGILGFDPAGAEDVRRSLQERELAPKKLPSQRRSQATFDALVEACARLLPERGYAGTTTNHIARRAGVNISSLYEYFPGKDAIVAQVAARLVDRVLARLDDGAARSLAAGAGDAVRVWLAWIHDTLARERALVAVFLYQVPYTNRLAPIRAIGARLLEFSQQVRSHAGGFVSEDFTDATLHLTINLVTSTMLQLVLDPPAEVPRQDLMDELVRRVEAWIRGSRTQRPRLRARSPRH